jgi:DNA-binding PadR family transcriptional regulator
MSSLIEKNLLLLGILKNQDIHGYQLNQFLKSPGTSIYIGKANAYQLLSKMEKNGFVHSVEKKEGKRPPRLVYSITQKGKEEFLRLLKDRLAIYKPIEYSNGVSLDFIGLLSHQEALPLLRKRQERLAIHCKILNDFSDDIRASHPGLEFLVRQAQLENELLEEIVEKYQQESGG